MSAAARPGSIVGMWPYHPDLLARPVPRYTSFPTAAEFGADVGATALAEGIGRCDGPVSLYVHIPYCQEICWYCGCNTGAAGRQSRLAGYMQALEQEIAIVGAMLPANARISRIAFGGGSPNALAPLAFVRLLDRMVTAFHAIAPDLSVEIDPRGLSAEWARVLGAAGVRSVSLGVQTFAPEVQQRIGRIQPAEMIETAVAVLRAAGVRSINFDLMYGLPGQDGYALDDTLSRTIALAPERIALFGYAHVPHLLPRQRRIDAGLLPGQADRFAMAAHGYERLTGAGYVPVGFDHFALPADPLAQAAVSGALHRNFQGFTDDSAEHLIGLGASAISIFPDRIIQNEKNAGRYRMRVTQGQLAGSTGISRSRQDRETAMAVADILCLRTADIARCSGADLVAGLAPFEAAGLIRRDRNLLIPTSATRPYARAIAALLDPYRGASRQFSSAV